MTSTEREDTATIDLLTSQLRRQAQWYRYFQQGVVWHPKGRDPVQIVDMEPEWRLNSLRFLERHAARYARLYAGGCDGELFIAHQLLNGEMARDSIESELGRLAEVAQADPEAWVKTTVLYQALAAGLPTKRKKLEALTVRAAHYSECGGRDGSNECTCIRIRARRSDAARRAFYDGGGDSDVAA